MTKLGLLDDIRWLFARGGMSHFLELKKHTYRDLTLEFLSTLHVKVTRGPQCQAGYISFYLQGQLYELNLGTFNSIFGFPIAWTYRTVKSPANSTRMHFGVNFRGVLGTTPVHQGAHILGTLALE